MPRQRSSMPARPSSNMSSSSGASFHTAHENRQSMYPGMQARVSDAGDSELARRPRSEFWAIVESTRHDQDSNSSRRQSRRHPSPLGAVSEAGECDSDDGSSRSSVSDYSLRPRDSASNRASSPSDDGYNPRNRSPRRNSRTHHRYEVEEEEEEEDHEYYDPRVGAIIIAIRPGARRDNRAVSRDHDHSSTSSGSYSARARSPRSHDGSEESSCPSDDSRRYDEYDEEYEEQFTPRARGSIGRSMSSRYDEEHARIFARQQIARENYNREQIALEEITREDYAREQLARQEEYLRAENRQNRRGYRY